jgi:hypothetical protein
MDERTLAQHLIRGLGQRQKGGKGLVPTRVASVSLSEPALHPWIARAERQLNRRIPTDIYWVAQDGYVTCAA